MNTPVTPTDKDALIAASLRRIEALVAQNAAVMAENARLAARVAELEAKLGFSPETPDNSSPPPSKGQKPSPPSIPKRKVKPHPGVHRLLHPDPTRQHDVLAVSCQACRADPERRHDRITTPDPTHPGGIKLKRTIRKVRSQLFVLIQDRDPEATNNGSKRALKPRAVYRKITNGFRQKWGARL